MVKVKFLLIVFLLVFVPLVSAQPPTSQSVIISKGLQIEVPVFPVHQLGQDFRIDAHVHNASTGRLVDNSTVVCVYHLYNSTGVHLIENGVMNYSIIGRDFEITIKEGNFSIGDYAILINCEDSGDFGGFLEFGFEINRAGKILTLPQSILYFSFIFIFFFFFIMLIYIANRLPEEHEQAADGEFISRSWLKYLHSVFVFVGWMLILGLFFAAGSLALGYLNEQVIGTMLFTVFEVMMALTYPIVIIWFAWIIASIFKDKQLKHNIEKGIFPNRGF